MTAAIGILGGTFDPIHLGHLQPALQAMQSLGLAQIRLMPNHIPPHRPQPIATAEQRLTMVRLAAESYPGFVVDDIIDNARLYDSFDDIFLLVAAAI